MGFQLYRSGGVQPPPDTGNTFLDRWLQDLIQDLPENQTVFDARDFGVIADGVTDDTDAVQQVIFNSAGSGVARFPQGEYLITSTISCPSQTRIIGDGYRIIPSGDGSTIFKKGFDGTLFDCMGQDGSQTRGITMAGITVDGNSRTGTACDLRYSGGNSFKDVEFIDNYGACLHMAQTWDSFFDNVWVRRSGWTDPAMAAVTLDDTPEDGCDRIDFYSLHCESNHTTHVHMLASNGVKDPKWVTFTNPKIHDFIPIASRLTVPLMVVEAAEHMRMLGGQFSIGSNAQLVCAADTSHFVGTVFEDCGGDYALEITGGSRSVYDITVATGRAQIAKIGIFSGAQNHVVKYVAQGAGSNFSNSGSNIVLINAQDGAWIKHDGDFRMVDGEATFGGSSANSDTRQKVAVKNDSASDDAWISIAPGDSADNTEIHFHNNSGFNTANIRGRVRYEADNDKMELWTNNAERIGIDASKVTFSQSTINMQSFTPASGSDSGVAGDITWDSNYIYVCTSANNWSRATLNSF